jgi:quercetin dioxygenase-like cupin family protein
MGASGKVVAAGEGERLRAPDGVVQIDKLSGTDTGRACAVWEVVAPPGSGALLHVHSREDESFFVIAGAYEFRLGGKTVRVEPGAVLFAPRGVPHAFKNVGTGEGRTLHCLTPSGLEGANTDLRAIMRAGGPRDLSQVKDVLSRYGITFLEGPLKP